MSSVFPLGPQQVHPPYHGLAPELLPMPAGVVLGAPAGKLIATGVAPSLGIAGVFGPHVGVVTANGVAPGPVLGNQLGPSAGQVSVAGAIPSLIVQVPVPPPVVVTPGTSGTYTFDPAYSEFILEAFARIQIRPAAITTEQIIEARRSLNLALQSWGNRGVNFWTVQQGVINLVQNQVTSYPLPTNLIELLDVYYNVPNGDGTTTDRYLTPISRTQYAAIPNKQLPGIPTVYWFDRLILPTVTIWQPDAIGPPNTVTYFYMRQIQDAVPIGGQTADMPQRFFDALSADLAARLAEKFRPDLWVVKQAEKDRAWMEAAREDREIAPITIRPDLSGYWR